MSRPVKKRQTPMDRLKDLGARVGEHFPEYVLIVRGENEMCWRFSDRSFAIGSMSRLQKRLSRYDDAAIDDEIYG